MNASQELAGILQQWLQLTQEEGRAIESAAWHSLTQIQAHKEELQKSFYTAANKHGAEEGTSVLPDSLRPLAGRVISLLARNGELLAEKLSEARAKQGSLEDAQRTLHQIQRSYVRAPSLTAWQSYS